MFKASIGGGAATSSVYRHALVRIISGVLGPVAGGSPASVAIAGGCHWWLVHQCKAQRTLKPQRAPRTTPRFVPPTAALSGRCPTAHS